MTIQYTDILRLALPETGQLDGTWGNTVNNSITQMVEEAITGKATIASFPGNEHTLTEANGTTSEARCLFLDLTAVLSATGTLNIPPNFTKLYIVKNATVGGFPVEVGMNTGAKVTVPNGTTKIIYSDGSDTLEVVTGEIQNVANSLVARDGSGNFSAGTITANLTGNVTGNVTGNADTATRLTPANWVVEQVGSDIVFRFNGVTRLRLSASGAIIAASDVTAHGTL